VFKRIAEGMLLVVPDPLPGRAGSIFLADDGSRKSITGTVSMAGPGSIYEIGDRIVFSRHAVVPERMFDCGWLMSESMVYAFIYGTKTSEGFETNGTARSGRRHDYGNVLDGERPDGTVRRWQVQDREQGRRELGAGPGGVILLLRPQPEGFIVIPEEVKRRGYLKGHRPLRPAEVVSSGHPFYQVGDQVLCQPDAYECLVVVPNDLEMPCVDVPSGCELRLYKGDETTIVNQVPVKL